MATEPSHPRVDDGGGTPTVRSDSGGAPDAALGVIASWSGPLPPPALLRGYNEAIPGLGNEIAKEMTAELAHRRAAQVKALDAEIADVREVRGQSRRGQTFGFVMGLCGLVGCVTLGVRQQTTASVSLGTVTVLGLVTVFVTGRPARRDASTRQTASTRASETPGSG